MLMPDDADTDAWTIPIEGWMVTMSSNSMEINNLTKTFKIGGLFLGKKIVAVDNVSINIDSDTPWIMALVGESGSGKTTLAKLVLKMLDPNTGDIVLNGVPLSTYNKDRQSFYRKVQPISQNPFTAFSSRRTVDSYLFDTAINLTENKSKTKAKTAVADALKSVGLDLDSVKGKYSNQFSGGELQRISIARALITRPEFIIADEPVAMIDASLRMNIINLFKKIKNDYHVNFIYITHDLSTAYYVSDYLATMYRGNLIEFGLAKEILQNPAHPYTELLMESIPKIGAKWNDMMALPDMESKEYGLEACRFVARCPYAREICHKDKPVMVNLKKQHQVLCYKHSDYQINHVVNNLK